MEFIRVTEENLEKEQICCAISSNKDCQVVSKKRWLSKRFQEGLVFLKANVRGKCFIEYLPAEYAFAPVKADGYMYINCLWVAGQYKGQGYSSQLLEACIDDSRKKGCKGLAILSADKKRPYLADPKYLRYKGFQTADTAGPHFELMYLPFAEGADVPRFREQVKNPQIDKKGFVLYYTEQCPFTAKYVPLIEKMAADKAIPFETILLETAEQAQAAPAAVTSYCLFYDGKFLTNEILSEKKFEKIASEVYDKMV